MNSSQIIHEGGVAVELKYCERCGGLWLRPVHDDESYCEGCRAAMAAWPRMARAKKKLNHGGHSGARGNALRAEGHQEGMIETLLGIAEDPVCNGVSGQCAGLEEVRI